MKKQQVSGYFRYILGDYEITSIYDGFFSGDASIYVGQEAKKTEEAWKKSFSDTFVKDGKLFTKVSVNTFLVNMGEKLILIDAGAGNAFGPTTGLTAKNLVLSGYNLDDVDTILMTHLHPDHVNGLTIDGKMIFPNATVYVNKADYEFWIKVLPTLKATLNPYIEKNQFKLFNEGEKVIDEVTAIPLPGHTVGHTGYKISSNNEEIFFWGDIIHDPDVQFSNMDVEIVLADRNEIRIQQEIKTAKETVNKVVKEKTLVGGPHLPFPGIGHVVENETGMSYRWIPVHYYEI